MARTMMTRAQDAAREREWFVLDAADQVLGRLAADAATILRGKHKPTFTPHVDCGDGVIVINAARVKLTGDKLRQKMFRRHSGYLGGLREIPYSRLMATHPERAVEHAIRGMLPKNRLGREMFRHLRVYAGATHEQAAQRPRPWRGMAALDSAEEAQS
jgi:large subunit ribosomal protein L13